MSATMWQFLFIAVFAHFIRTVDVRLTDEAFGEIKESDFVHRTIMSVGDICSSIPKRGLASVHVEDLKCFDSVSQDEQQTQQEAGTITNLDEYIHQLGSLGCFILVNNFRGFNIPQLNHPVVLRFPRLVALPTMTRGAFDVELFWVPHHLYPSNSSRSARERIKRHCKLSKFFATFWENNSGFFHLYDYCLMIIQHLFAFSAKPWKCEVQIGLFPLMKLYEKSCGIQHYPRMFKYEGFYMNTDYMLSLSKPTINVIVTHKLGTTGLKPFQELMVATFRRRENDGLGGPYVSHSVFLHAVVSKIIPNIVTREFEFVINFLKLVRASHENALKSQTELFPVLIRHTNVYFKPENLSESIRFTSSPPPESMSVWRIDGLKCRDFSHNRVILSPEAVVSELRGLAWQSVFGNYTFQIESRTCCSNGVVHNYKIPDGRGIWSMYLGWRIHGLMVDGLKPMVLKYVDTFRSLCFISCNSLQHEALMFHELISMYDAWIWECLICSMILLAATNWYLGRRGSFFKNFLAVFKVVVGQSDPFMRRVLKSRPLRYAAVTFLFMGTILNEGYKNENMYLIISPRKIITQEKFSQLIRGRFTVYTRTSTIKFLVQSDLANPALPLENDNNHIISSTVAYANSEVNTMTDSMLLLDGSSLHPLLAPFMRKLAMKHKHWFIYSAIKKFFLGEFHNGNLSFDPSPLFQAPGGILEGFTKFTESQVQRLQEIGEKWMASDKNRYSVAVARSVELARITSNWEEKTLFSFLQNCTRAAVILPERLCVEYAMRLRIKDNQHYSIGKELFLPRTTGISLTGLIPPVIIRRIKWMEASGIWEWHSAVVRKWKVLTSAIARNRPATATMSGNVSIIFLILPVGIAPATIGILFEMVLFRITQRSMSTKRPAEGERGNILLAFHTMLTQIVNVAIIQANVLSKVTPRKMCYFPNLQANQNLQIG